MRRSGPVPRWTEQVNVFVGESINDLWTEESRESKLAKSVLARIAITNFFEDYLTIITLLPVQPGERRCAASVSVSPEQLELITKRADLLQISVGHVASMAVASRYVDPENYHLFDVYKGIG